MFAVRSCVGECRVSKYKYLYERHLHFVVCTVAPPSPSLRASPPWTLDGLKSPSRPSQRGGLDPSWTCCVVQPTLLQGGGGPWTYLVSVSALYVVCGTVSAGRTRTVTHSVQTCSPCCCKLFGRKSIQIFLAALRVAIS